MKRWYFVALLLGSFSLKGMKELGRIKELIQKNSEQRDAVKKYERYGEIKQSTFSRPSVPRKKTKK